MIRCNILIVAIFFFLSCSRKVMEAVEVTKFNDIYFYLRKNGRYSFRVSLFGVVKLPSHSKGRYIISRDTVYFVKKKDRGIYETYNYGLVDSVEKVFWHKANDSSGWNKYKILK